MVAESDGRANANRGHTGIWETFEVIHQGGNTYAFKSYHGKYLVAESNGKLNANRAAIGTWEKFEVTCNDSKLELSSILRTFGFNSNLFYLQISDTYRRFRQNV